MSLFYKSYKSNNPIYCTIVGCDSPDTHNIASHKCTYCNKYGHNFQLCNFFQFPHEIIEIPVNKQCKIKGCLHSKSHTNGGHQCRLCKTYGHSYLDCQYVHPKELLCVIKNQEGPIYIAIYDGMGFYIFYRRKDSNREFETFNMGPYGNMTELMNFIKGYFPLRECDRVI